MHVPRSARERVKEIQAAAETLSDVLCHAHFVKNRTLQLTRVDQTEALALSHEIAVMNEGRIIQIGSPRAIYEHPRTKFVAEFIGSSNFIEGTVLGANNPPGYWRVRSPLGDVVAHAEATLVPGASVTLSVRPENVELSETPFDSDGAANLCTATVDSRIFQGDFTDFQVRAGGVLLLARTHPSLRTQAGDPIHLRIAVDKCVVLAAA